MKNYKDITGNRSRDFAACNVVPQSTAPPRASVSEGKEYKMCRERVQMFVVSTFRYFPCVVNSYKSTDQ